MEISRVIPVFQEHIETTDCCSFLLDKLFRFSHCKGKWAENLNDHVSVSPLLVFLCILCLLALLPPSASSCPPPCLCYPDGLVDCGGRGLSSLPPLHLLPPGSRSLLLANNKLALLGASALANLSSLEVCCLLFYCLSLSQ